MPWPKETKGSHSKEGKGRKCNERGRGKGGEEGEGRKWGRGKIDQKSKIILQKPWTVKTIKGSLVRFYSPY